MDNTQPNVPRKKLLLLGDDISHQSGVARIERMIISQTCDKFEWYNIGANNKLPKNYQSTEFVDATRIVFESDEELTAYTQANPQESPVIKIYKVEGFGTLDLIYSSILENKIDAIVLFTDPKRFTWLFNDEYNIRRLVPIFYINIWDNLPYPKYNKQYYESCDALFNISRQTENIVKVILGDEKYISENEINEENIINKNKTLVTYFPHGSNPTKYYNIMTGAELHNVDISTQKIKLINFIKKISNNNAKSILNKKIIYLFAGRNTRRKNITNILASYKNLLNSFNTQEERNEVLLIIKSDIINYSSGTNIYAAYMDLIDNGQIILLNEILSDEEMNYLYNICDYTLLPSLAEGFGIPFQESIYAGKPVIATVTGGIQDQMRYTECINGFKPDYPTNCMLHYTEHGNWCIPLFGHLHLVGTAPTPYIYENVVNIDILTNGLKYAYDIKKDSAKYNELLKNCKSGRDWMLSTDSKMNMYDMGKSFKYWVSELLKYKIKRKRLSVIDIKTYIINSKLKYTGTYNTLTGQWE